MPSYDVQFEETPTKGKAYIGDSQEPQAAMTFSKAGTRMIIIDHTEVSEALQGQGVGRQLLNAMVALARERKVKVLPLCPYAKSVFAKDASIRDVLR